MIEGVERLTALALLLTGLSHMIAPRAWDRLFAGLRDKGDLAGLANAAINLPLGLLITAFHPVWTWPGALISLMGWALLLKGALNLIFPQIAQTSLVLAGEGATAVRRYRLAGIVMTVVALGVGWIAIR